MRRLLFLLATALSAQELNDVHFHLTNYVQEGTPMRDFLALMGTRVGRVALFGIPLQQQWSSRVSGDSAPTYYLNTDAPLYYYSFTPPASCSAPTKSPARISNPISKCSINTPRCGSSSRQKPARMCA